VNFDQMSHPFQDTISAFAWRGWGKPQTTSLRFLGSIILYKFHHSWKVLLSYNYRYFSFLLDFRSLRRWCFSRGLLGCDAV